MSEIQTADGYLTSTVEESNLPQIKEDLGETELIGYTHNSQEGEVTVILDLTNMDTGVLRYIH